MGLSVLPPLGHVDTEGEDVLYIPQVSGSLLTEASPDHISDNTLCLTRTVAFLSHYEFVDEEHSEGHPTPPLSQGHLHGGRKLLLMTTDALTHQPPPPRPPPPGTVRPLRMCKYSEVKGAEFYHE